MALVSLLLVANSSMPVGLYLVDLLGYVVFAAMRVVTLKVKASPLAVGLLLTSMTPFPGTRFGYNYNGCLGLILVKWASEQVWDTSLGLSLDLRRTSLSGRTLNLMLSTVVLEVLRVLLVVRTKASDCMNGASARVIRLP